MKGCGEREQKRGTTLFFMSHLGSKGERSTGTGGGGETDGDFPPPPPPPPRDEARLAYCC